MMEQVGRPPKYDWSEILMPDAKPRIYVQGVDFGCNVESFRQQVYQMSNRFSDAAGDPESYYVETRVGHDFVVVTCFETIYHAMRLQTLEEWHREES
jgi:hypothetical protein